MTLRTIAMLGMCHLATMCMFCGDPGVDRPTDGRTFIGFYTSEVASFSYPKEQEDSAAVVFALNVWEDCCNASRRFHSVEFRASGDTLVLHPLDSVFALERAVPCDTVACTHMYHAAYTFYTIGTRILAVLQQDTSDTVFYRCTMDIVPDSADTTMQALSVDDLPTHTSHPLL